MAKSNKPQVYAMIQWSSRGMDDAPAKFTFDLELLERALALPNDDEARDDFMEELTDRLMWDVSSILGSILKPNLIKQWNEKKSVGDLEEEFTWGIALTKIGAKAAFADAMNDAMGGDDDWGDEE